MAKIDVLGKPANTQGDVPKPGSDAPDFKLVNATLENMSLSDFAGKKKILNIVPSLDTPTCATSTRKFNERAGGLDNTVVLVISADLPFAQKRFCEAEGIENVIPLSMMRSRKFAKDYGVLIANGVLKGITARAVVVIDENDKVVHSQLVKVLAEEPDYDAALAAASG